MLGIVIVGLLVMTQLISLKNWGNGIWRGFLVIALGLIGFCVLKGLLLPILISWLVILKHMVWWLVIIVLAIIAVVLLGRILISRFEKVVTRTEYPQER